MIAEPDKHAQNKAAFDRLANATQVAGCLPAIHMLLCTWLPIFALWVVLRWGQAHGVGAAGLDLALAAGIAPLIVRWWCAEAWKWASRERRP